MQNIDPPVSPKVSLANNPPDFTQEKGISTHGRNWSKFPQLGKKWGKFLVKLGVAREISVGNKSIFVNRKSLNKYAFNINKR